MIASKWSNPLSPRIPIVKFDSSCPPKRRHYCRMANGRTSTGEVNYWFDLTHGKIERFKRGYGRNFLVIIYRDEFPRDYFAIPYDAIESTLTISHLDSRNRWSGTIRDGILSVYKSPEDPNSLDVRAFKNTLI